MALVIGSAWLSSAEYLASRKDHQKEAQNQVDTLHT
jgi:hypothetical protein